jgi:hypothetical protein
MLNFSAAPYYDDFDETKHFHKILFKPGYAVQARELTQLQTIIQNQIERFGNWAFTDGYKVHGGDTSLLTANSIPINSFTGTSDLSFFKDKIVYIGSIRKEVVHTETINGIDYIFTVDKTNGAIVENSTLLVEGYSTYSLTVESSTVTTIYGQSLLYRLLPSIYYVSGVFAKAEDQIIVVSLSNIKVSSDIYLVANEYIITSNDDESLLDNAYGSPNYAAPGADRHSMELILQTTLSSSGLTTNSKHFLLNKLVDGVIVSSPNKPETSDFENLIAERTYNESGDYTVIPFIGQVYDDLTDTTKATFKLDAGTAYIKGFEVKKEAQTSLSIDKARTTAFLNNSQVTIDKGPYIVVENLTGLIFPYSMLTVDIHSSTTVSTSSATYNNTKIGTATVFGTTFDSLNSGTTNAYKLFITNIAMNTGKTISGARSFIIKTGSGTYTWTFKADYSTETYDKLDILGATVTDVTVFNSQNYTQLFPLLNKPVKTHVNPLTSTTDISYQYYKEFLSTTFSRSSGSTVGSFTLSGNQFFIGSGIVPSTTVATQWYAVVKTVGSGTGTAPTVGTIIKLESGTVNIASNTSATVTLPVDYNLTLDVFTIIGESVANNRNKVKNTNATLTVTGESLTASTISLLKADGYRLVSVIDDMSIDHTSKYEFYTGQKDAYYDHAYIKLVNDRVTPKSSNPRITSLTITFDYFSHTGTGPLTVDSYTGVLEYETIPVYRTQSGDILRLSDTLDFRPRRTDGSTTLLFDSYKKPNFGSYLSTDYEYYLPRIDRVAILSSSRDFAVIKGIPSKYPLVPDAGDAMTLYTLTIPAYTFDYKDIVAEYVDNKRYTMKDIAKIDKRVNRLEYYATLSLLEKQATDEAIPSDVPGIDKFKNGILVDPFAGHSVGDVFSPYYNCAIDFVQRVLRPAYVKDTFDYVVDESGNSSVLISNNHAVLEYSEVPVITQAEASEYESVQPFNSFNWNGVMDMDPPTDIWVDTTSAATSVVNLNGEFDHITGGNGQVWSDWQTTGVGITAISLNTKVDVQSQVSVVK